MLNELLLAERLSKIGIQARSVTADSGGPDGSFLVVLETSCSRLLLQPTVRAISGMDGIAHAEQTYGWGSSGIVRVYPVVDPLSMPTRATGKP